MFKDRKKSCISDVISPFISFSNLSMYEGEYYIEPTIGEVRLKYIKIGYSYSAA